MLKKKKRSIVLHCGTDLAHPPVHPSFRTSIHLPVVVFIIMASRRGPSTLLHFLIRSHDEVKETCRAESMKGNADHVGSCVVSLHTACCGASRCRAVR